MDMVVEKESQMLIGKSLLCFSYKHVVRFLQIIGGNHERRKDYPCVRHRLI